MRIVAGVRATSLCLLLGYLGVCSPVLADPVVRGEEHCVVNVRPGDALNMRARPAASAQIVARKRYDECGILVNGACRGSWCPVEDGHALGWAHRRFLAMVSPAIYCVAGVAPGDTLNLRRYPSSQSRVIRQLSRRQCNIAFLPYAAGNWQKIRVDGWQGWAYRRHLSGQ
jgi:SH3-like domain-containing protein